MLQMFVCARARMHAYTQIQTDRHTHRARSPSLPPSLTCTDSLKPVTPLSVNFAGEPPSPLSPPTPSPLPLAPCASPRPPSPSPPVHRGSAIKRKKQRKNHRSPPVHRRDLLFTVTSTSSPPLLRALAWKKTHKENNKTRKKKIKDNWVLSNRVEVPRSLSRARSPSAPLSRFLSFSLSVSAPLSLSFSVSLALSFRFFSLSLSFPLSLSLSLSRSLSHTHSLIHTISKQ